jgi:hypothetical protein
LEDKKSIEEEGNKRELAYCVDPSFNVSSDSDSFLVARVLDQICEGFRSRYRMLPEV